MGKLNRKRKLVKAKPKANKGKESGNTSVPVDVKVDLDVDQTKYDAANPFILPANKNDLQSNDKTVKEEVKKPKRILSKKKQKKLLKVLDRKKRSQDRSTLLEELKKHQLDDKTYNALASASAMHTKGFKRNHDALEDLMPVEMESRKIKTSAKMRRTLINTLDNSVVLSKENVVGFERSDDSESSEESDDDEEKRNEKPKEPVTEETNELNNYDNVNEKKDGEVTEKQDDESGKEKPDADFIPANVDQKIDKPECSDSMKKDNKLLEKTKNKSPVQVKAFVDMRTRFIQVNRDQNIEESRARLPIISEEQTIMETIRYNDVTILCGETGSGKTTQIPQFLYEAGYAIEKRIGITEPRRVAAIAMSQRVGQEMNLSSDIVSYQIRFEGNVSESTKIKFMTDGILLKEIQKDLLLTNYSVIIIDEAHERTVYSDILIGLLSRIVRLRSKKEDPLKLIIMSATLRIHDFTDNPNLFKDKPPVIKIDSRQFPVSIHFSKKTPEDYLHEAYIKVCKIHRKMPKAAGILVFLTGQQEVISLCQKLRRTFPYNLEAMKIKQQEMNKELEEKKLSKKEARKQKRSKAKTLDDIMPKIDLDSYGLDVDLADDVSDAEEAENSSDDDDDNIISCSDPIYCLPLFSHLNEKRQQMIFQNPPEGCRLCVVATNIAETSLTIPNIKYVIDTGKVKVKVYDQTTGISTFIIDWTSQASANQRAGRAGRVGPGHCYRLYSSAVFNDNFKEFSDPEIVRKPIDDLVLQMKSMNIDNVVNFPFPTPPPAENIIAAEKRLILLGALEEKKAIGTLNKQKSKKVKQGFCKITPLGKVMSYFPLSPRYAKMLVLASQHNLISYAVAIVSALTVQEVFHNSTSQSGDERGKELRKDKLVVSRKKWAGDGNSLLLGDIMILLSAIGAWEYVDCTPAFCERYGLRLKAMNEIRKLRLQLLAEIGSIFSQLKCPSDLRMEPPSDDQAKCLRQVLLSGLFDHVARKIPEDEKNDENRKKLKNGYQSVELNSPVYISHDSVLHDISPEWVVYQEIYETQKLYMRNVFAIEPNWLPLYAPNMCKFSKPLEEPSPRYDADSDCIKCTVTCTFGPHCWNLPETEIEHPEGIDKYRWFIRHLLDGDVISYFASKRPLLLSSPSIMLKSWAKLQKRTEIILNSLVNSKICTKRDLIKKWLQEPKFLLTEYCQWIPVAYHMEIDRDWPPITHDKT